MADGIDVLIAQYRDALAVAAEAEATMREQIEEIRARFQPAIEKGRAECERLTEAIRAAAEASREGTAKSMTFPTGVVRWRSLKQVEVTDAAAALEALHARGLTQFIKVKEDIDKVALKREPNLVADIPAIRVTTTETFSITPAQT